MASTVPTTPSRSHRRADSSTASLSTGSGMHQETIPTVWSLSPLELIDFSRQGLAGTEAGRVGAMLAVTDKEMAALLNQSVATFHRQAKADKLDMATSERLLLLAKLAAYGRAVFQDQGKFTGWLRRPLRLFDNRSPFDLLDTTTGIQLVEDVVGRIEYGVFS